jgi:hypothetical protein
MCQKEDHQDEDPRHEGTYIIVGFVVIGIALFLITPEQARRVSQLCCSDWWSFSGFPSRATPDGVYGDPI